MKKSNFINALFSLFGQCKKEKIQYAKGCDIHKTDKEYKIITMYKTDSGLYHLDEPVFFLPISSSKEELLYAIQKSISVSKLIKDPPSNLKDFLRIVKERSLTRFYKSSVCCSLYIEGDDATIEPRIYLGRGLVPDSDRRIILKNFREEELIEEIVNVLKK